MRNSPRSGRSRLFTRRCPPLSRAEINAALDELDRGEGIDWKIRQVDVLDAQAEGWQAHEELLSRPEPQRDLARQLQYLIDKRASRAARNLEQPGDMVCREHAWQASSAELARPIDHRDLWETWIPGTRLVLWYRFTATNYRLSGSGIAPRIATRNDHTSTSSLPASAPWASQTCWHLARRGKRVLGLDRYDIPNTMGSSHGVHRIIRLAYFEHPSYVPILRRAYELWRETEQRAGEQLLFVTGSLDIGPEGSAVITGSLESCRLHNLHHELLTGDEVNRRFPGYRLPADFRAVLQPDGGFVASERAIVAAAGLAMDAGAVIRGREAVFSYEPLAGGGVRVTTDRGTYEAGRLVLASGAWIGEHVPSLKAIAVPERQALGWFRPKRPESLPARRVPGFQPQERRRTLLSVPGVGRAGLQDRPLSSPWRDRARPTRCRASPTPATKPRCAGGSQNSSPMPTVISSPCAPACSPTRPTSTSSSTRFPISPRSSSPRPARATASSSPAPSARSWPTWRWTSRRSSISRCSSSRGSR